MSELLRTSPLGIARRFEAAGFRAWPAASVHYDGTWVIRLTAGQARKPAASKRRTLASSVLDGLSGMPPAVNCGSRR